MSMPPCPAPPGLHAPHAAGLLGPGSNERRGDGARAPVLRAANEILDRADFDRLSVECRRGVAELAADELGLVAFLRELEERFRVRRGRSPSFHPPGPLTQGFADCRPGGFSPHSAILWSSVL